MSLEYPPDYDPHHLLQAKECLLSVWHELPPEHQATMLLVLLNDVVNGDYQAWVLDAVQQLYLNRKGNDGMG